MKLSQAFLICISFVMIFAISSCSKSTTSPGPRLVSPANNSLNIAASQIFTCSSITNATVYQFVFVDNTTGGTDQAYVTSSVNTTNLNNLNGSFLSLTSGHVYSWYVLVTYTNNSTQTTPTWSFTAQ